MRPWPDIPYARFAATGASLHMWSQVVGKFRLAHTPWANHSWQATFYVSARGFGTGLIPIAGAAADCEFDFRRHALVVRHLDGREASVPLTACSVAEFHAAFLAALEQLGLPTDFHGAPNEVSDPVPFHRQTAPGAYDADAARDFHRALVAVAAVFSRFRTGFLGKVSPVHLFWGSFDLAVTRFSGRPAPLHPGGFPALPDDVTREAYSHEVSSAGFWPGGNGADEAMFYSYAYPVPDGFAGAKVAPAAARFDTDLGEFLLPYSAVRTARDPQADLLAFLESTYAAAAQAARWPREALDCPLGEPRRPRRVASEAGRGGVRPW